jgi:hypothetical protein
MFEGVQIEPAQRDLTQVAMVLTPDVAFEINVPAKVRKHVSQAHVDSGTFEEDQGRYRVHRVGKIMISGEEICTLGIQASPHCPLSAEQTTEDDCQLSVSRGQPFAIPARQDGPGRQCEPIHGFTLGLGSQESDAGCGGRRRRHRR